MRAVEMLETVFYRERRAYLVGIFSTSSASANLRRW